LYRHIVEDSRVAMIYGDAAGIMRLWNKGAEDIFGWTAEEALGRSMDLIIPEKHRATHWEGYYRVMKTGVTKYGRNVLAVPALTKGGRRVSIEFNVVLLKAPSGEVIGIAAILQDVTARWERDKALRQRLAAAEAKAQAATH
jgi:PAS domain S-box-containing protein